MKRQPARQFPAEINQVAGFVRRDVRQRGRGQYAGPEQIAGFVIVRVTVFAAMVELVAELVLR